MPMLASTCNGMPTRTNGSRSVVAHRPGHAAPGRVGVVQHDAELVTAHPGQRVAVAEPVRNRGPIMRSSWSPVWCP